MLDGAVTEWAFAARTKDARGIQSCSFGLRENSCPLPHFDGLAYCIEQLFLTGKPMYPVERTLPHHRCACLSFRIETDREASLHTGVGG